MVIIDEIIKEPIGGAHRDAETTALEVKNSILKNLEFFENFSKEEVYDHQRQNF